VEEKDIYGESDEEDAQVSASLLLPLSVGLTPPLLKALNAF
jgi:hypothetical protein